MSSSLLKSCFLILVFFLVTNPYFSVGFISYHVAVPGGLSRGGNSRYVDQRVSCLYLLPIWRRTTAYQNNRLPEKIETTRAENWITFRNLSLSSFQKDFHELDHSLPSERLFPRPRIIARLIAWWLQRMVRQRTQYVKGLLIKVSSGSSREILMGKLQKIEMTFDAINFAQLYVSGGGRILIKGLDLTMRKFLFLPNAQSIRKPYLLYTDLLFTQSDIMQSKLIRNLIQLLVDTILTRVLIDKKILSASIRKVTLNDRRIQAQGVAKLLSDNPYDPGFASIDFEVSTSAAMKDQGQTLYLRDMQVVLNPDSILRTTVAITTTSPIDVDLGDNCRIDSLVIANKNIWIRAALVISPIQPFAVTEMMPKALYHFDLAAFFSNLMKINGGIAVRWAGASI